MLREGSRSSPDLIASPSPVHHRPTTKLGGANGLSFVIPLAAVITSDNLDEGLAMCEGKPDAYLLDNILTDEEVQQYFK